MAKEKNKKLKISDMSFDYSLPELQFSGNKEVVIEGSRGVLEYSQDKIRINTNSMVITFCGRNLNLRCISSSALIIDGFILNVEFTL